MKLWRTEKIGEKHIHGITKERTLTWWNMMMLSKAETKAVNIQVVDFYQQIVCNVCIKPGWWLSCHHSSLFSRGKSSLVHSLSSFCSLLPVDNCMFNFTSLPQCTSSTCSCFKDCIMNTRTDILWNIVAFRTDTFMSCNPTAVKWRQWPVEKSWVYEYTIKHSLWNKCITQAQA